MVGSFGWGRGEVGKSYRAGQGGLKMAPLRDSPGRVLVRGFRAEESGQWCRFPFCDPDLLWFYVASSTSGGLDTCVSGLLWEFSGRKAGLRMPGYQAILKEARKSREQEDALCTAPGSITKRSPPWLMTPICQGSPLGGSRGPASN